MIMTLFIFSYFFDNISRIEADNLLLAEKNKIGTFLIRPSEQTSNGYTLFVKDWDNSRSFHIKHYKIKPSEDATFFFIVTNRKFSSIAELIAAYKSKHYNTNMKYNCKKHL